MLCAIDDGIVIVNLVLGWSTHSASHTQSQTVFARYRTPTLVVGFPLTFAGVHKYDFFFLRFPVRQHAPQMVGVDPYRLAVVRSSSMI